MTRCFVLCPGWAMPDDFLSPLAAALRAADQNAQIFSVTPAQLYQRGGPCLKRFAQCAPPNARWIGLGHSLGFALLARAQWPWSGLVSIAGFVRYADPALPAAQARAAVQRLRKDLHAAPAETLRRFRRRCGLTEREFVADLSTVSTTAHQLHTQLHRLARLDAQAQLARLRRWRIPLLALAGHRDTVVPAAWTRHQFKHQTLIWHEQAGHDLGHREAVWCEQQLNAWLSGTGKI